MTLARLVMMGGTPQGSPLSPALFTVYGMSSVVWDAEERLQQRKDGRVFFFFFFDSLIVLSLSRL